MSQGFAPNLTQPTNRPKTLEAQALSQRLKDCFASIKDLWGERTRLHQLGDILTIAILTVLAECYFYITGSVEPFFSEKELAMKPGQTGTTNRLIGDRRIDSDRQLLLFWDSGKSLTASKL